MIGEAYCNKCAHKAGQNGYECDRCAGLPHLKPFVRENEGATEYYVKCPFCKGTDHIAVPGNLESCAWCGKEYVSEEME